MGLLDFEKNYFVVVVFVFFFNDTATTEIYTLSLHDALPIWLLFLVDIRHQRRQSIDEGIQQTATA